MPKTDKMGKLMQISIVLKDDEGIVRRLDYTSRRNIDGILSDTMAVGDFIRDCAGPIRHKGDPDAN